MEENPQESFFKSLSFLQRLAGLNYHIIRFERGQRKKAYEFLLGLPWFILLGIVFTRGRDTSTSTFKLEQFVVCGLCFFSVFGLTRLVLKYTSAKLKDLMDLFEKKQDRVLRNTLIRYSLIYYGISFLVILVLAVI